jgi:dihydrofolate synthase/folylpolyglutamate synthase
MTYPQTIDFLYSKLPMFTRVGAAAIKKDLHNTIAFCEALDHPEKKFKSIHIAGTNGKGSTSHMLAAILQKAGYKTGLYTSPHLKDFRERIRINGQMAPKAFVKDFVKRQKANIHKIEPSFFEVTVAMAFDHFAKEQVDIAVIEVGLGGRLDSTNIIQPELGIITNISLDHTNILGNTLPEIAFEKAGIIKKNTPIIIGEKNKETAPVFLAKADKENAPITFVSDVLAAKNQSLKNNKLVVDIYEGDNCLFKALELDLTPTYQLKNVLAELQSIFKLRKMGYQITDEAIVSGLKNVKQLTGLQGRWQTLGKKPLTICDTGHNEAGIDEVLLNINQTPFEKLHIVIGMVKDKDITTVLSKLPKNANYYFCQPALERALSATELTLQAEKFGLKGKTFNNVKSAYAAAKKQADAKDLIFIGGSTFVVAEVL